MRHSPSVRAATPTNAARTRAHAFFCALLAGLLSGHASAASDTANWLGTTNNNWGTATNWSGGVVPDNNGATFDVFIDNGDAGTAAAVTLNVNATIESLTVDLGDSLSFNNARSLTIAGSPGIPPTGFVVNNGDINVVSGGSLTDFRFEGGIGLTGSGTVTLGASSLNRITTDNTVMLHGAGHTIRGGGNVLANTGGMSNEGNLIADATGAMVIDPNSAGFVNLGVMSATGSGGMQLNDGVYTNSTSIDVATGSKLEIENGVEILGGTLSTTGTGIVNVDSTTGARFDGVTIADGSTVVQNNSHDSRITSGLTNDGTWQLNDGGSVTQMTFEGGITVGGTGRIDLNSSSLNRIVTDNTVLTQATDHTIEGAGALLFDTGGMLNQGTIIANEATALVIDPNALGFTNDGVLRADGSGGLQFNAGVFTINTGVEVADGSTLELENGVEILGGTLTTTATGVVNVDSTSTAVRFDAVTIAAGSTVVQANARDSRITGGLVNEGAWQLNDGGSVTEMLFEGDSALTGGGRIDMNSSTLNRILSDGNTITHASTHTIEGAGSLLNNTGGMVNEGSIIANETAALIIDPDALGFTNNSVLRAEGSGGIDFNAGTFTNTTTIEVLDGSRLDLNNDVVLQGGTLQTTDSGKVFVNSTTSSNAVNLDGVTIAAGSTVVQANATDSRITGGLANEGTWQLNDGGSVTEMLFEGDSALTGGGRIDMSSTTTNRIVSDGNTITHASTHTIEGAGSLLNNTGGMVNEGSIIANETAALIIDPDALGFTNNSVLRAEGSGGIDFNAGTFINTTTIEVLDGSRLDLNNDVVLQGGTLQTVDTGRVFINSFAPANAVNLDGVTIAAGSTVVQANATDSRITGGLVNEGAWQLNDGGSVTEMLFEGDSALTGGGRIDMNSSTLNRILSDGNTITHASTHTIEGAGSLLNNTGGMVNEGSIIANETAALIIDPDALGFTNNSVLRAEGSGGIDFNAGTFINTTTIEVLDGSRLDLNNDVVLQGGTLQTVDTGRVFINSFAPANAVNLDGVTIAAGSTVVQANAVNSRISNALTNDGTWQLNDGGSGTDMVFEGSATLGGTGRIDLSNSGANRITTDGTLLTQLADHTIEGSGALLNNTGGMVNQGTVQGNQSVALTVNPGAASSFDNQGTVIASDGGTVTFTDSAEVTNVVGNTLNGGTWNVLQNAGGPTRIDLGLGAAEADITTNNASITLSGVSARFDAIDNLASNQGTFKLADGQDFDTVGAFANTGNVDIADAGTRLDTTGIYTQTAGNTNLAGGTLSGTSVVFSGGSLTGSGTVEGATTVESGVNVAAGASPGVLNFNNATVFQTGSILDFELAGTNVDGGVPNILEINTASDSVTTAFDQLNVFDTATIEDGVVVNIASINGFSAVGGNFWDLVTADTLVLSDPGNLVVDVSGVTGVTAANITFEQVTLADSSQGGGNRDALRMSIDAVQVNAIWNGDGAGNGADGNFTADNWVFEDSLGDSVDVSPITFPSNTDLVFFNAIIDDGKTGTSKVTLNDSPTLDGLSIDAGNELEMGSGRVVTVVQDPGRGSSGIVTNNGIIDINSIGESGLRFSGNGNLVGTGLVELGNNNNAVIGGIDGDDTLTQGASHTIEGRGRIGPDLAQFDNAGTVRATTGQLIVGATTADPFVVNNTNLMEATGGGDLVLDDGRHTNDGTINAADGSTVTLNDGMTLIGGAGTLESDGTGRIRVVHGNTAKLEGTITNNALVELNAITEASLGIEENTTLDGTGSVTLLGNNNAIIRGIDADETLTQGASHSIEGRGRVGIDLASFINLGTVDANIDGADMTLGDDATVDGLDVDNSGTLGASNGGRLNIANARVQGGTLHADGAGINASIVRFEAGATIAGGTTLESTGAGIFEVRHGNTPHLEGTITNNARLEINAITEASLGIDENTTLNGTGSVVLQGNNNAIIRGIDGDETLIQGASHSIEGRGRVGIDLASFINQGTVDANIDGADMTLGDDATVDGLDVSNSGTLGASNGGRLNIANARVQGGTLHADGAGINASIVRFETGATIAGGTTLESTGAGIFEVRHGNTPHLEGTITNNARIEINPITEASLGIDLATTLTGTGTVVMGNSNNARIIGVDGDETLTNAASHTIEGGGRLGFDTLGIVNAGTVIGNNGQMRIDPRDTGSLLNQASGTLRGATGGSLLIQGGNATNSGTVEAIADGGNTDVTFDATATVTNRVGSSLNGGTWRAESVDGTEALVDLQGGATVDTLGGTTTVTLSGTDAELRIGGSNLQDTLTSTAGTLNVLNGHSFDTAGTLGNTGAVNIDTATLNVGSGGNYDQSAGTTTLTNGTLNASAVNITGGSLLGVGTVGGDLNVSGGGTVATGFSPGIMNVTGAFDLGLGGNWSVDIQGTDAGTPDFDQLNISGIATFGAGAAIDVSLLGGFDPVAGNSFDLLSAASIIDNTGGLFSIFDFSAATLDPSLIYEVLLVDTNADTITDTLRLNVALAAATGVLEATWDGGAGNYTDANWTYTDTPPGVFPDNTTDTFFNVNIDGNKLGTASPVALDTDVTIDSLHVDSNDALDVGDGRTLTIANDAGRTASGRIVNEGQVNLNGSGTATAIVGEGDLVISGGGTLQMSDDTANSVTVATGATLTNESAHSIAGAGTVGSADANLVNKGTIDANVAANALVLRSDDPLDNQGTLRASGTGGMDVQGDVANTGLMQAQGGSTLAVSGNVVNDNDIDVDSSTLSAGSLTNNDQVTLNAGTLDVTAPIVNSASGTISGNGTVSNTVQNSGAVIAQGGTLTVNGAGIEGGSGTVQIDVGASLDLSGSSGTSSADLLTHNGDDLNLGSNDFRVDVDYVNGNSGSGNAFDARANVTGSGAIDAGGDVGQEITGDVTGGDTITATLAFGDVHVGTNTSKNYQVANTGTTGPSLRGAIQTDANGGNITDARLEGAGVTAANIGPIATGADTGNRLVRFDASSAGELTDQVVHIENNFDNVANQDIQITGTAYNLAEAQVSNPQPIDFGAFHVGDVVGTVDVGVSNAAPVGVFSERLNGQVLNADAGIIASGTGVTKLNAGETAAAGSFGVSIDTSSGGAINGDARFTFQSDGDGINSLGITNLPQESVAVTGEVWDYAVADATNVLNFGATRVGGVLSDQSLVLSNIGPDTSGFTETLRVDYAGVPLNYQVDGSAAGGSFDGIEVGISEVVSVSLLTDTSGDFTGSTLDLDYTSEAAAGTGLLDSDIGSQGVQLNGKVYQEATASAADVDLGILRKNTGVQSGVAEVTNTASGALVDVLTGGFTGPSSPFTTSGALAGVTAGTTDTSSLEVSIDTTTAGVFNATGTLELKSHNDDLADVDLAPLDVNFTATVNELANPVFAKDSGDGAFAGGGSVFTLDFGTIVAGSNESRSAVLRIDNDVVGPADFLKGDFFNIIDTNFSLAGFDPFMDVGPGGSQGGFNVSFDSTGLGVGSFGGEISFDALSTLLGGVDPIDIADITLQFSAEIIGDTGAFEAVWDGGAGDFTDANWTYSGATPIVFPDNTTDSFFNVFIDGDKIGTDSEVTLDSDVTIDSLDVDIGDSLDVADGRTLTIARDAGRPLSGRIVNDGDVLLSSTGTATAIVGEGDLVISGGGTLQMSDDTANSVTVATGATLTNESAHSIAGAGTVGSADANLVNKGTIDANVAANALVLRSDDPLDNQGTLRASGTGGMDVQGDVANTGLMQAQGGSTLAVSGNVVNDNDIDVDSSTLSAGSLTNNDQVTLNAGTLDVTAPIVNSASGTISGNGTVSNTVQNSGAVIAQGGTLTVNGAGIEGGSGTVQIDAGASLDLSGSSGTSSADLLTHNGDDLNLGSNDFRVDVDYVNGNSGSGNAFDARANVTGSGAIDAGGDVGQEITGDVTGGDTTTATLAFGDVHVGTNTSKNYQVANTGTTGPSLRGALQTTANGGNIDDARLSGNGVTAADFGPLGTGAATGDLAVTFDATSDGALTGQVVHVENNFDNVANQDIQVTGTAWNLAQAEILNVPPVDVGNYHVGDIATTVDVNVRNSAPASGFSERLNGSVLGADAGIVANGSFSALDAGATTSGPGGLTVSIDTSTAGLKSGTAQFGFESDGTGLNTLGVTTLGSQSMGVSGAVWAFAQGDTTTPVLDFGATRVGGTLADQTLNLTNTAAPTGGYTETLRVDYGASPFNYQVEGSNAGGSVAGIGATSSANLDVSLLSNTSGDFSGQTLNLTYTSEAMAGTGLLDSSAGGQTVTLNGKVYQAASASALDVDFGVLRKNQVVASQGVAVTNTAGGALVDVLTGGFVNSTTPFTTSGLLGGVAAGTTDDTSLQVSIDTSTAGVFSASGGLQLASHNDDMADLALTPLSVAFNAVVNELANPVFALDAGDGALSGGGTAFTLDFGTIVEGSGDMRNADLSVLNDVVGPADFLKGEFFNLIAGNFLLAGFDPFMDIAGGDSQGGFQISFDSTGLGPGTFLGEITLDALSTLAGGVDPIAIDDVVLRFRARIVAPGTGVPAPATLLLMLLGVGLLFAGRRKPGRPA